MAIILISLNKAFLSLKVAVDRAAQHPNPIREARNQTSHAYDDIKARDVFNIIKIFIPYVQNLIEVLNTRINNL